MALTVKAINVVYKKQTVFFFVFLFFLSHTSITCVPTSVLRLHFKMILMTNALKLILGQLKLSFILSVSPTHPSHFSQPFGFTSVQMLGSASFVLFVCFLLATGCLELIKSDSKDCNTV